MNFVLTKDQQFVKEVYEKVSIEQLQERVAQLEKDKKSLMNRCYVHTQGLMCIFCGFKEECEHTAKKVDEPKQKTRNRSNIFG